MKDSLVRPSESSDELMEDSWLVHVNTAKVPYRSFIYQGFIEYLPILCPGDTTLKKQKAA